MPSTARASPCVRKERRPAYVRYCSTTCFTRAPSGSGTWVRCSATSGRRRGAIASSIRSASRPSASTGRTSTPSSSRSCARACGTSGARAGIRWRSIPWGTARSSRAPRSARGLPPSSTRISVSTRMPGAACTGNPLRILDTKNPDLQAIVVQRAAAVRSPWRGIAEALRRSAVVAQGCSASLQRINPRLVRGLDYYNRTVFEWVTDQLGSHKARSALVAAMTA
jgi:hypothetical protein